MNKNCTSRVCVYFLQWSSVVFTLSGAFLRSPSCFGDNIWLYYSWLLVREKNDDFIMTDFKNGDWSSQKLRSMRQKRVCDSIRADRMSLTFGPLRVWRISQTWRKAKCIVKAWFTIFHSHSSLVCRSRRLIAQQDKEWDSDINCKCRAGAIGVNRLIN